MIKLLSNIIVKKLKEKNDLLQESDLLKMNYTLQVILGDITKFIILIFIFSLIGKLKLFIIIYLVFISLRLLAGGRHCKNYITCLTATILHFLFITLLSELVPKINETIYLEVYIMSFIIMLIYAPCPNINRPIKNKKILKILSMIVLIFWIIVFEIIPDIYIRNCIFFSVIAQSIQIITMSKKGCF